VCSSDLTRADEVEAAWAIVSPIHKVWDNWDQEKESDVCFYEAGTWGPDKAEKLIEHDNRRWRKP